MLTPCIDFLIFSLSYHSLNPSLNQQTENQAGWILNKQVLCFTLKMGFHVIVRTLNK